MIPKEMRTTEPRLINTIPRMPPDKKFPDLVFHVSPTSLKEIFSMYLQKIQVVKRVDSI